MLRMLSDFLTEPVFVEGLSVSSSASFLFYKQNKLLKFDFIVLLISVDMRNSLS